MIGRINPETFMRKLFLPAAALDDGVRWLATIRDPAGNTIGIVQPGPR